MSVKILYTKGGVIKLDGVGPIDNRPSMTSSTPLSHFFLFFIWHVTCDMWHVTCDMWHVTCDMWHVTHDMWHLTHDIWQVGEGDFFLLLFFSSLALTVWEWRCSEDISTNHDLINQSVGDGGVCRTAPATPGLLKNHWIFDRGHTPPSTGSSSRDYKPQAASTLLF